MSLHLIHTPVGEKGLCTEKTILALKNTSNAEIYAGMQKQKCFWVFFSNKLSNTPTIAALNTFT